MAWSAGPDEFIPQWKHPATWLNKGVDDEEPKPNLLNGIVQRNAKKNRHAERLEGPPHKDESIQGIYVYLWGDPRKEPLTKK
jgi:hypothetical protein